MKFETQIIISERYFMDATNALNFPDFFWILVSGLLDFVHLALLGSSVEWFFADLGNT